MGKSSNETRLTGVQNSCRLNRRSSTWAPLEQEALLLHNLSFLLFVIDWHPTAKAVEPHIEQEVLLPHKLSSLLFVLEWHLGAKLHDLPMRP